MLRTIRNILILLLIGITASGMPIYASTFNYSDLIPSIISKDPVIIATAEEKVISNSQVKIKYGFTTDQSESYTSVLLNEDNPFIMELTRNGNIIHNISLDDVIDVKNLRELEIFSENPFYITFDFDQNKLDLPNGSYNLKLYPNAEDTQFALDKSEFDINFSKSGTYVSALPTAEAGQMPLTLYFPDKDLMHLVPITRFIPYTSYPLTTTLRNLEIGPDKEIGLLNDSPIPPNGKAGKVGETAYVNLPADLGVYDDGSAIATTAVNSMVNSLTSVDEIDKVQFQFNGKVVKDAFHGMAMDNPYLKIQEPMIYAAYISDTNRFLLTPIPFISFGTVSEKYNESIKIPTMFNTLKFNPFGVYNSKIHPIVPDEAELLEYSISNGMLSLTFNEAFEKAYEGNRQLHQMMIDGIVFTFTHLNNVDFISIKVKLDSNDSNSQGIKIYDFDQPVYINPEN